MSALRLTLASVIRKPLLALTGLMLAVQASGNTLEDIRFAELPGERFEVRMLFSDMPPQPEGYTIENPARIVLDFPDVDVALEQKKFPLAFANSKSVVILSAGGRSRMIMNLESLADYKTRIEGAEFVVEVGAADIAAYEDAPTRSVAASVRSERDIDQSSSSITDIDFRRGEDGEGKIIFTLSDANIGVDVEELGAGVRINFMDVWLPEELRRRLDVTDFATPVSMVSADHGRSGTSVQVDASGAYDYLAYQADNEYVVSIKPLSEEEQEEKKARFDFVGEKLSLNFQDIEVRSVLQLIADFTELNLVASDTVSGRITLRLENVPWDQALDLVLKTKGLDKRQIGNVLMVAPAEEIADRERQELATQKQLEELAPLRTEFIRVRYANAKELFELFKGQRQSSTNQNSNNSNSGSGTSTGSILSERGQAIVDERTNSIILTDTDDRITAFKLLVEKIDVPIRQVLIEARIVIANTDFRKEIGVRWGGIGVDQVDDNLVQVGGSIDSLDSDPGSPIEFFQGGTTDLEENMMVDLGVANPAGSFALSVLSSDILISAELTALQDDGHAEIVSQPKVITGDKQQASIESGQEIPYQEASSSGATSVSFKEAVLKLDVTPQITPDNRIIMDLKINQDSVSDIDAGSGVPIIDVTQLQTQVLVGNGQTVVLGGIYQNQEVVGETKVPFLGDIPYLGRAFKQNIRTNSKTELLIFITPRILSETLEN